MEPTRVYREAALGLLLETGRQDDAGAYIDRPTVELGEQVGPDLDEPQILFVGRELFVRNPPAQRQTHGLVLSRFERNLQRLTVEAAWRARRSDVAVGVENGLHVILAGRQVGEPFDRKRGGGGVENYPVTGRERRDIDPDRRRGGPAGATDEAPGLDPVAGGHDDEETARGLRRQRGVERDLEAEARADLAVEDDGGQDRDE